MQTADDEGDSFFSTVQLSQSLRYNYLAFETCEANF